MCRPSASGPAQPCGGSRHNALYHPNVSAPSFPPITTTTTTSTSTSTAQNPTWHLTAPRRIGIGGSGDSASAGAGYLGRSAGKWLFEVEVLQARDWQVMVGIAGTNFRGEFVGWNTASWAVGSYDGIMMSFHRHAERSLAERAATAPPPLLPARLPACPSAAAPCLPESCTA